uniref:Uncharacterized protein n=1 Tax=Oryza brachyantha TaxID=4533 RepID=J3MF89_ORYBR
FAHRCLPPPTHHDPPFRTSSPPALTSYRAVSLHRLHVPAPTSHGASLHPPHCLADADDTNWYHMIPTIQINIHRYQFGTAQLIPNTEQGGFFQRAEACGHGHTHNLVGFSHQRAEAETDVGG